MTVEKPIVTFVYCPECNEVYEMMDKREECTAREHTKYAILSSEQYIKWILDDKPILNIKKKEL